MNLVGGGKKNCQYGLICVHRSTDASNKSFTFQKGYLFGDECLDRQDLNGYIRYGLSHCDITPSPFFHHKRPASFFGASK